MLAEFANALIIFRVCEILEGIVYFQAMRIVAKHVFFEPGLTGKGNRLLHLSTMFAIILMAALSPVDDIMILLAGIAMVISLFFQESEKNRFLNVLVAFPIVGIMNGLFGIMLTIPKAIFNILEIGKSLAEEETYVESPTATIYAFSMSLFLIFVVALLSYSLDYRPEVLESRMLGSIKSDISVTRHNRTLGTVEKILLYSVGVFELIFFGSLHGTLTNTQQFNEKYLHRTSFFSGMLFKTQETKVLIATLIGVFGVTILTTTIIVIVVIMIGNKRNFYRDQINGMQFNIIVMMAEIIENRDKDTGGHIQRTAKYVEIITKSLRRGPYADQITEQFINDIIVAAPLHDIGKIHVSDVILNKPDRLTAEEFDAMKSHAVEGRQLLINARRYLGDFTYLDMAIDMASYHHEWWDGSGKGYPEHLAGEQIPLCARIMAVADVFDALTAKRIYKDPLPFKKSVKIIQAERGTHFDPIIVDAFIDSIEEVKAAFKEFEATNPYNAKE